MCAKRFMKFASVVLKHKSPMVQYVFKNAMKETSSTFKTNVTFCLRMLEMPMMNVEALLHDDFARLISIDCGKKCSTFVDRATAGAIRELVFAQEGTCDSILQTVEANELCNFLCTF